MIFPPLVFPGWTYTQQGTATSKVNKNYLEFFLFPVLAGMVLHNEQFDNYIIYNNNIIIIRGLSTINVDSLCSGPQSRTCLNKKLKAQLPGCLAKGPHSKLYKKCNFYFIWHLLQKMWLECCTKIRCTSMYY